MNFILLIFILIIFTPSAAAGEITGNIEFGEKYFDLFEEEEEDSYVYWRAYLRYQKRIKAYSNYSLRYELQKREYTMRERYTSLMHEVRSNLTYQLTDSLRYYLRFVLRTRNYPHAVLSTYWALIPELQLNFYPSDKTTWTTQFSHQRRFYPEDREKDYRQQSFTLSVRHSLLPSLTLNGRYRAGWEFPLTEEDESFQFEHRIAVGFRYVLD